MLIQVKTWRHVIHAKISAIHPKDASFGWYVKEVKDLYYLGTKEGMDNESIWKHAQNAA